MPRNEIADLYVIGTEFTLEETGRPPIKVWLQKLNDIEHSRVVKKARAAQARVLVTMRDQDSEEYLGCVGQAYDAPKAVLVDKLLVEDRVRFIQAQQSRLAEDEEWSKDNYLEGLRTAWTDGSQAAYLAQTEDEPDDEATRVSDELQRFDALVSEAVEADLEERRTHLEVTPMTELQDEVVGLLVKEAGTEAWVEEYHRCEVWLATRRCTHGRHEIASHHREAYFESRGDVDDLQTLSYLTLSIAIQNLAVPALEGKDSGATPPSSIESDSPEESEVSPSSGLVVVPA